MTEQLEAEGSVPSPGEVLPLEEPGQEDEADLDQESLSQLGGIYLTATDWTTETLLSQMARGVEIETRRIQPRSPSPRSSDRCLSRSRSRSRQHSA
jgi:hypothetical protein